MERIVFKVRENISLNNNSYILKLEGDTSAIKNIGEFVEIKIPGFYLNRPISICYFDDKSLYLLIKKVGNGTKYLSNIKENEDLVLYVGLGNGFTDLSLKPLIIAGGIGIAPFIKMIEYYKERNIKPILVYGDRTKDNILFLDYLKENTTLYITTDDGSLGYKGNPVGFLKENNLDFDCFYACGPQVLMKNLSFIETKGYVSLEARMGCGFGACMGCNIMTTSGSKRVCKEGPIFLASEVIYE